MEADKAKLAVEVNELNDQAVAATKLKRRAEEEADQLKEALQARETNKLVLLQKMQELTAVVDCWSSTMAKSTDEYLSRLKFELHAAMAGSIYQPNACILEYTSYD